MSGQMLLNGAPECDYHVVKSIKFAVSPRHVVSGTVIRINHFDSINIVGLLIGLKFTR